MNTPLTYQTSHVVAALNEGKLIGTIQALELALELVQSELDLTEAGLTLITKNSLNSLLEKAKRDLENFYLVR
jgi:hypothetical protein